MGVRQLSVRAFLLRQVPLANDDVLLTFLTDTHGLIKVFAAKLQRSKQKKAELDYFRLLELELTQPKDSFKLRGVRAVQDFSSAWQTYAQTEVGFTTLSLCAHFCPEEKPVPEILSLLPSVWTHLAENPPLLQSFFYTKLLWYNGVFPRFDTVRIDCAIDPISLSFFTTKTPGTIRLSNTERQMLEFIRRSDLDTVLAAQEKFSAQSLQTVQHLLEQIVKNH